MLEAEPERVIIHDGLIPPLPNSRALIRIVGARFRGRLLSHCSFLIPVHHSCINNLAPWIKAVEGWVSGIYHSIQTKPRRVSTIAPPWNGYGFHVSGGRVRTGEEKR